MGAIVHRCRVSFDGLEDIGRVCTDRRGKQDQRGEGRNDVPVLHSGYEPAGQRMPDGLLLETRGQPSATQLVPDRLGELGVRPTGSLFSNT
jgi:hypothetical protein